MDRNNQPIPDRAHFPVKLMPDSTETTLDLLVFLDEGTRRVRINKAAEILKEWVDKEVGQEFDICIPVPVARGCGLVDSES